MSSLHTVVGVKTKSLLFETEIKVPGDQPRERKQAQTGNKSFHPARAVHVNGRIKWFEHRRRALGKPPTAMSAYVYGP